MKSLKSVYGGPVTTFPELPLLLRICGCWASLMLTLSLATGAALETNGPPLQFLEPTNNALFSTLDEIPIVLKAAPPGDAILTASIFANQQSIATASYCCWLCPCAYPQAGQETTLQIPVPRTGGMATRTWQGWTNVPPGSYRLTARATGELGTVVEAIVNITVVDPRLRINVSHDGSVVLSIPQGSLLPDSYDAEASADLVTWTRLGQFQPGNVAAFYFEVPPESARQRRFYRSVYVRRHPQ